MGNDQFLEIARNLARYHREHEKFYSRVTLENAASLHRTSGALRALAERWSEVDPEKPEAASPFSGAEDLNDDRATELAGILFMEGQGEPAEIARIKEELRSAARGHEEAGEWLADATDLTWKTAEALLQYPALADLFSERHRIISNNWQAASIAKLTGRNLDRAVAVLDHLKLTPDGIRADLAGPRTFPDFIHSACDLIDHAADLSAQSAVLEHEDERRWRVFRERVNQLVRERAQ
jgi:hypothetical protein